MGYSTVIDSRKSQKDAKSPIFITPVFASAFSPWSADAFAFSSKTPSMNEGLSTGAHAARRPPMMPVSRPNYDHVWALVRAFDQIAILRPFVELKGIHVSPGPVLEGAEHEIVDVLVAKAESRHDQ